MPFVLHQCATGAVARLTRMWDLRPRGPRCCAYRPDDAERHQDGETHPPSTHGRPPLDLQIKVSQRDCPPLERGLTPFGLSRNPADYYGSLASLARDPAHLGLSARAAERRRRGGACAASVGRCRGPLAQVIFTPPATSRTRVAGRRMNNPYHRFVIPRRWDDAVKAGSSCSRSSLSPRSRAPSSARPGPTTASPGSASSGSCSKPPARGC